MCMYKQKEIDDDDEDDDGSVSENEDDDEISGDALKPIIEKVNKALERFDSLLQKSVLKCKVCDFEAKNKNGLNMHLKSKHTKQ